MAELSNLAQVIAQYNKIHGTNIDPQAPWKTPGWDGVNGAGGPSSLHGQIETLGTNGPTAQDNAALAGGGGENQGGQGGARAPLPAANNPDGTPIPTDPSSIAGALPTGQQIAGFQPRNVGDFGATPNVSPSTYAASTYNPASYGSTGYAADHYTAQGYDPHGYNSTGYNAGSFQGKGYEANKYASQGYGAAQYQGKGYDAKGVDQSALPGLLAYNEGLVGKAMEPRFQNEQRGLDDSLAGRGIVNSGAGAFMDQNLKTGQDAAYAQAVEPLVGAFAGYDQSNRQYNAEAANQAAQYAASVGNQSAQYNASARDAASQFGANAGNQAGQFNAQAANAAGQFGAAAGNESAQYNAQAGDAARQFGASSANQAAQYGASAGNAAGQFGAASQNQAGQYNAQANDAARQFGASAANAASAGNAAAANRAGEYNSNSQNQAGQFGAQAGNEAALANAQYYNADRMYNANGYNNYLSGLQGSAQQYGNTMLGGFLGSYGQPNSSALATLGNAPGAAGAAYQNAYNRNGGGSPYTTGINAIFDSFGKNGASSPGQYTGDAFPGVANEANRAFDPLPAGTGGGLIGP